MRFHRFKNLNSLYIFLGFLALAASSYAAFKPGISKPSLPSNHLKVALNSLSEVPLSIVTNKSLNINSSDRMLSDLYRFRFRDGSEVSALMVRVAKRDEFKIETYGILTKNIPGVYIKNPSFLDKQPVSLRGPIDSKDSLQTCVIPGSSTLSQVDVRLSPLTATVHELSPHKRTFLTKLLGSDKPYDYSCLVLTFQPSANMSTQQRLTTWPKIVNEVQNALRK
jgi:hypothetical protein